MSRFNAGRYVAAETAISVAVNVVLAVAPAALSGNGQGAPVPDAHGLAGAALPLFMGAFMSALVPSLLTRRRQLRGKLRKPSDGGPAMIRVVSASLLLAASSTTLGALLTGTAPLLAGQGLTGGATLFFKAASGGLVAVVVTPSALFSLFGREWRRHGSDKRAGDGPFVFEIGRGRGR